jgi:DNA invertase Pin-like site-specific DNA recombinase
MRCSYARVSAADQAARDLSVPDQFRRLDEYGKENNIQVVQKDADEGVSAFKDNEKRDGFW